MIKTILVEDEQKTSETIANMLNKYCKNVRLLDVADNVKNAILKIKRGNPDLVLLDINLPDGNGFDVLNDLNPIDFKVVFITAYEEYAIKAFKFDALDYILKPVDHEELINAVNKVERIIENRKKGLKEFLNNDGKTNYHKMIFLNTSENIHMVDCQDIIYCKADGIYTEFFLTNAKKICVSKSIKEYEEMLGSCGFFRAHKSYLINLIQIDNYMKKDGGFLVMKNQSTVPVSNRRREQLFEIFRNM